jgi:hypothetical protein
MAHFPILQVALGRQGLAAIMTEVTFTGRDVPLFWRFIARPREHRRNSRG